MKHIYRSEFPRKDPTNALMGANFTSFVSQVGTALLHRVHLIFENLSWKDVPDTKRRRTLKLWNSSLPLWIAIGIPFVRGPNYHISLDPNSVAMAALCRGIGISSETRTRHVGIHLLWLPTKLVIFEANFTSSRLQKRMSYLALHRSLVSNIFCCRAIDIESSLSRRNS